MSFINHWLRDEIKSINAYQVPPSENMLKLDAMESPFPLSDRLIGRYLAHLAEAELNRYPSANANALSQTLRALMDIPAEFGMLLGNGSDELIQLLALGCSAGDSILSVEPSFVMYKMIAKFTKLNYYGVALTDDFEIDQPAMQAAIKEIRPKLIFIAYPNNPTGNAFERKTIETLIQSTDALVVLDEAYYAYAKDSFLADIKQYPNLVLLRTVSKIGFAGLRLGVLIGEPETITQLDKLRLPYNINILTQVSGHFLLQESDEIAKNTKLIIAERQVLSVALKGISGLQVYPSQANFILFKAPNASALFSYLESKSILIKNLSNVPKLKNCLRVTVGSDRENQQFINHVREFYD